MKTHRISKRLLPITLIICSVASATAQDNSQIINKTANNYALVNADRRSYVASEKTANIRFYNINGNADISQSIIMKLREICISKNPLSMRGRLGEMESQIQAYYGLTKTDWINDVPENKERTERKKVKSKILDVGRLLYGDDYVKRYAWALDEVRAYNLLNAIKFDTSVARKKYPNSYQSQLRDALGIRPE